jgi:hypothetical protein
MPAEEALTAEEAATVDAYINSAENRLWEQRVAERWAKQRGEPSPGEKYRQLLQERFTARKTAASAKRRADELQRTPAWADMKAIGAIYREARRLTKETGKAHHVDHVIPLRGKLASGLHVAGNLQVLPGAENVRKSNRFEP